MSEALATSFKNPVVTFPHALQDLIHHLTHVPQPPWLGALGWILLALTSLFHGLYLLRLQKQNADLFIREHYWRRRALRIDPTTGHPPIAAPPSSGRITPPSTPAALSKARR